MMNEVDARSFGRMEGKLDQLLSMFEQHSSDDATWHQRLDERLRIIEQAGAFSTGRVSVLSAVVGFATSSLAVALSKHFF